MGRTTQLIILATALWGSALPCHAQSGFESKSALDQLKLAYEAMGEADYEGALRYYTVAAENAATRDLQFQGYLGMGSAASALADPIAARAAYEKALEIKPGEPAALYSLAMVAKEEGAYEEAVSLFAEAAVRDPTFGAALTQLGVVYSILGRHEKSADACWRAFSMSSDDLEALVCVAVARYHLGLYAEAAQSFLAVLEKDPEHARARYGLGLCKIYRDDRDGAIQDYVKLKELDPDLAKDLYNRIFPDS